jgi:hypothetical protein
LLFAVSPFAVPLCSSQDKSVKKVSVSALALALATVANAQLAEFVNPNEPAYTVPGTGALYQRAPAAILFDQGPIFTQTGAPNNLSIMNNTATVGYCTLGFAGTGAFRVADDFTVPAGQTWVVDKVTVFGYQTGATAPSINAGTLRLLSTSPAASTTPTVVFGDATTNVLTTPVTLAGTARVTSTTLTNTQRLLQAIPLTISPAVTLAPGTYWIDFTAAGTVASGPFFPPLSPVITAPTATGNAIQQTTAGAAYVALNQAIADPANPTCAAGTTTVGPAQGVPFIVEGVQAAAIVPVTPAGTINANTTAGQTTASIPLNFTNPAGGAAGTVSCALTNAVNTTISPTTAVTIPSGTTGGFVVTGSGTPGSTFSGTVTCTIPGSPNVVYTINGVISAVTSITTLSNFGLIALALMLVGFGALVSRRN